MTDPERTAMLERLLPLIDRMATKFFRRRWAVPIDDLKQEAAAAVWKTLDHYNPDLGELESWAGCRIWGSMLDAARKQGRFMSGGQRSGRKEKRCQFEKRDDDGHLMEREDRLETVYQRQRDGYEGLVDLIRGLTAQEREICLRRFVKDEAQSEIGKALGVHESYVSQVLKRTMAYLRSVVAEREIHIRGAA